MPINQILWTRARRRRSASVCWEWSSATRRKLIREASSSKVVVAPWRNSLTKQSPNARPTNACAQKPSPLLDGSEVWKVPRDEVLYVDVELEPSFVFRPTRDLEDTLP